MPASAPIGRQSSAAPETGEPPAAASSMASSTLWAAVSQISVLAVSAVAALIILLRFGKGADTDAVFAAYGLYSAFLLVCQALRLTVVPRIVEAASPWAAFDRFLGAGIVLLLLAGVAQIAFGPLIADLLTADLGSHAHGVARWTLAILWPALCGQLVAALAAAVLAVRGEFRYPGLAYLGGGVTYIALLLGLSGSVGILSVSIGVAVGAILTGGLMMLRLRHYGYRPQVRRVLAGARESRTAALMLLGSVAPVLTQVNYVVSVSFAAHLGVGAVTLYTTAFFAAAAVVAVTASAASIVLAAPVAQTWDRRPATLLPHLVTIMRAGMLLIGPAVAVVALLGDDVLGVVLGSTFSPADADRVVETFVALSGLLVGVLATQLPLLAAFALHRYARVAWLALGATVVHVAATAIALELGSVVWLGVAASVGSLAAAAVILWAVHGSGAVTAMALVLRESAAIALACLVTFGAAGLVTHSFGSGAWDALGVAVGAAAFGLLLHLVLPRHAAIARRMLAPLLPARLRSAPA